MPGGFPGGMPGGMPGGPGGMAGGGPPGGIDLASILQDPELLQMFQVSPFPLYLNTDAIGTSPPD